MVYHNNVKDIESPAVVCILDTIQDFFVQVGHETTFANNENCRIFEVCGSKTASIHWPPGEAIFDLTAARNGQKLCR